jgi:hypothetical protein
VLLLLPPQTLLFCCCREEELLLHRPSSDCTSGSDEKAISLPLKSPDTKVEEKLCVTKKQFCEALFASNL